MNLLIKDWAIKCLEKGFDSKSLRMLASTTNLDSAFQSADYFNRILKELDWNEIDRCACLLKYAKILAREIIEDKVDFIKACRDIYHNSCRTELSD